jgi:PPOX class probable F420-dependent enzyme
MDDMEPRFRKRLESEPIAWLTTVSGAGVPSAAPVWFRLRDDDTIVVYSRDPSVRLRNLDENPNVNLHLEGNRHGGDILAVTGTAVVDRSLPGAADDPTFLAKYREFLEGNGWTPQWFEDHYPTPIVISIDSHIGW